jgi:mRNA interferase RelE/StbE
MRQRLRVAISALGDDPRPDSSQELRAPSGSLLELRRIRLANWRIVYGVDEADRSIAVIAIRRRPPYRYDDLDELTP